MKIATPKERKRQAITKSERLAVRDFLREVASHPDIRVFRNNVGTGFVGTVTAEDHATRRLSLKSYRRIRFGLIRGSGDYIGWKSIAITPDMVGRRVAVFTSAEIKSETGRPDERQKNWRDQVRKAGGIAVIIKLPRGAGHR